MFNSYEYNPTNITKVNAVSGMLQKQYAKSFILRFDRNSKYEDQIFSLNPHIKVGNPDYKVKDENGYIKSWVAEIEKPIVVLQVMLCGDSRYISELMWKEDFEEVAKTEIKVTIDKTNTEQLKETE